MAGAPAVRYPRGRLESDGVSPRRRRRSQPRANASPRAPRRRGPVFVDETGRRARLVRALGMVAGVLFLGLLALITAGLMGASWVPRVVPRLGGLTAPTPRALVGAGPSSSLPLPNPGTPTSRVLPSTGPGAGTGAATGANTSPTTSPFGTAPPATTQTRTGPSATAPGQAKHP
jgi:hypothetical protein